jgi:8-oxo-dGTP diphosphatase
MPASEQGVSIDHYLIIPRVLIFVRRGDSVLLLKGAASKHLWAGRYNGVGGHMERAEDPLSAARRELFEETGLTTSLSLCGTLFVDTGENQGVGIFIFTGEFQSGNIISSSEGTLEWISWNDLPGLPHVEDLPALSRKLRIWKFGDTPFTARSYYDPDGKLIIEFVD